MAETKSVDSRFWCGRHFSYDRFGGALSMGVARTYWNAPRTEALRRALTGLRSEKAVEDLLFLESWEAEPLPGAGAALRVGQLRRANPHLAAEIRAELRRGRPLTATERAALETLPAGRG